MQLCSNLNILWHCPSLRLEGRLTFSSPVATAEFSKSAGILSAALSQYHLSGFKIGLKDLDNHGGMVIHLELDTLECEVKWALGSITMNKANGELFNDAIKCCTKYVRKFGKLCSGHRNRKGQFSFQSQRRAIPKNVQTTVQLCLSPMLVRLCSKLSS